MLPIINNAAIRSVGKMYQMRLTIDNKANRKLIIIRKTKRSFVFIVKLLPTELISKLLLVRIICDITSFIK